VTKQRTAIGARRNAARLNNRLRRLHQ
jgi:hypothetical protein